MLVSISIEDPQEGLVATIEREVTLLPEALDLFKRALEISGYSYVVNVAAEKSDGNITWSDDLDYIF
jgi:hypothetical protein